MNCKFRTHYEFPDSNEIDIVSIFKPIHFLPRNISTCKGFGFACTDDPVKFLILR